MTAWKENIRKTKQKKVTKMIADLSQRIPTTISGCLDQSISFDNSKGNKSPSRKPNSIKMQGSYNIRVDPCLIKIKASGM